MPAMKVTPEQFAQHMTPIDVPKRKSFGDWYATFIFLVLTPGIVAVFLLGVALFSAPLLLVVGYTSARLPRPRPLARVPRDAGFYVFSYVVLLPLSLPLILLAINWALVVFLVTLTLSLPVGASHPSRTAASLRKLGPFMGRPGADAPSWNTGKEPIAEAALARKFGLVWPFADLVVAVIGGAHRQGCCELVVAIPLMIALIPAMKVMYINPMLFALEDVFINQWSDPLDADGDGDADAVDQELARGAIKNCITSSLLREKNRAITDAWPFVGHHQLPPEKRPSKTVAGLQMGCGGKCTLISHTTHPYDVPGHVPRSEDASWGLIVVRLQAWNPFYQLAGYVEVNVRKDHGVEHPMWLVVDPSSQLAMDQLQGINRLFVRLGYLFAEYLREQPEFKKGSPAATVASDSSEPLAPHPD